MVVANSPIPIYKFTMSSVKLIKIVLLPVLLIATVRGKDARICEITEDAQNQVDRLVKKDLNTYITSLGRVLKFFEKYKESMDTNANIGLFLCSVNLKKGIKATLPKKIHYSLLAIIYKVDHLLRYFKIMAQRDEDVSDLDPKKILPLFDNQTNWLSEMKPFDKFYCKLPKAMTYEELQAIYPEWYKYGESLDDQIPVAAQKTDFCFESLGVSTTTNASTGLMCNIPQSCIEMTKNGPHFGYPLTHRVLMLNFARYARGCFIFSPEEDQKLVNELCNMCYKELEYINFHKEKQIDLMMEQIITCALNNKPEFMRQSWLNVVLNYQTTDGCFSLLEKDNFPAEKHKPIKQKWRLERTRFDMFYGACNTHISALAAGAISAGVRYILDVYY